MRRIFRYITISILLLSIYASAQARELKQSTAANVMIFMTDSTDHVSGKTGLTLTITASKDGAAFASVTPTVTERGNGWYNLAFTTSHTDTLGDLCLHITSTGADPTDMKHTVVANIESDTYATVDTEVGAIKTQTDKLLFDASNYVKSTPQTNVTLASGTHTGAVIPTVTSVTNDVGITQAGADKAWGTATRALTDKANFTLASGEYANIWNNDISAYTGTGYAGTYLKNLWDKKPAGSFLSDDVWTATKAGYIDAAVSSRSTLTAANVWEYATRTLTSGGYSGLTATDIDNIWDELTTGHTTASSFAKLFIDNINATIGSRSSHSAADVWGVVTRTLTAGTKDAEIDAIKAKTDNLNFNADVTKLLLVDIRDVNDASITGVNDFKADVSNLDVAVSTRLATSGYTAPDNTNIGNIINLLRNGTGYATCPTNKSIWDALGDGTVRASSSEVAKVADYTSARAAKLDNLDTTISSRGTSNLTTSDNIGINWADVSNPTAAVDLSGTTISTSQAVASVSGAVGSVTGGVGGNVTGSVGSISGVTFPTNFNLLSINASGQVTAGAFAASALADMFDTDSGTTYANAVAGSVVKEIADNASSSTATDWTTAEKQQIRDALGVTGTKTTATGGQLQDIKTYTNGAKDGGDYNGIEVLIRKQP